VIRFVVCLFLGSLALQAADLTGIWVGRVEVRKGDMQDVAFQFHQTGSKLEGKLYGDYKSSPIVQGTVVGAVVSFIVASEEQAGNQINESQIRFTGRLENGEIELMRERESSHTAGSGAAVEQRKKEQPRQAIHIKRLT
jgi:hypothetical protein